MTSRLEAVRDLRNQYKQAFLPVPPHPSHEPPQGQPPGPPQGQPVDPAMQQGPPPGPPQGPPPDPAMQGAPPADPSGAAPPSPDVIALMQETVGKLEEFGKGLQSVAQRQEALEKDIENDRAIRRARKETVDAVMGDV